MEKITKQVLGQTFSDSEIRSGKHIEEGINPAKDYFMLSDFTYFKLKLKLNKYKNQLTPLQLILMKFTIVFLCIISIIDLHV